MLLEIDENELQFISKVLYTSFDVPISVWNEEFLQLEYNSHPREHPLITKENLHKTIIKETKNLSDKPVITSLNKIEHYLYVYFENHKTTHSHFIAGPILTRPLDDSQFLELINSHQIPFQKKQILRSYLESLPIRNIEIIKSMGQLLYYLLFERKIEMSEVINLHENRLKTKNSQDKSNYYMTLWRSKEQLHHDNLHEKNIALLIREGRYEDLKKFIDSSPPIQNTGTVAENPVRNEKNLAITAIAIASRAAIDGGLHTEVAYSLSDLFIQQVENDDNFVNMDPFVNKMFLDYAKRVKDTKEKKYSKYVVDTQQYIYSNLYKKIDLNTLADYVYLNPKYLSRIFKEEVGIPISEYIQEVKIEEAKIWLENSNLTITEICFQLNFHDQSHFSRTFKRIVGISPNVYRKKHLK